MIYIVFDNKIERNVVAYSHKKSYAMKYRENILTTTQNDFPILKTKKKFKLDEELELIKYNGVYIQNGYIREYENLYHCTYDHLKQTLKEYKKLKKKVNSKSVKRLYNYVKYDFESMPSYTPTLEDLKNERDLLYYFEYNLTFN